MINGPRKKIDLVREYKRHRRIEALKDALSAVTTLAIAVLACYVAYLLGTAMAVHS